MELMVNNTMSSLLFQCPYCEKQFNTLNSLRIHSSKLHKKSSKQVYIDLFCNGIQPTCKCGCGTPTKFYTIQQGFTKFAPGHQSRVNNNWGHNKKVLKKSQQTRHEMYNRGEIKIWNRGKTKKTDDRIAAYGIKGSQTLKLKYHEQRSKLMRHYWEDGIILPLKGEKHPNWKGGISSLQPIIRARLYSSWVYPILKRDQFTCQCCGMSTDLCVHHSNERFADIMHKIMYDFGFNSIKELSFEQKDLITEKVVQYHVINKIPGITICKTCHQIVHSLI